MMKLAPIALLLLACSSPPVAGPATEHLTLEALMEAAAWPQPEVPTSSGFSAGFVVAALLLAALHLAQAQGFLTWIHVILGHLIVAVAAMVASVALYAGRTDFTR